MTSVLVTGATGFVGRHLCESLVAAGCCVTGTSRNPAKDPAGNGYKLKTVADLGSEIDWGPVVQGVDCVVHLAARVHVMHDTEADPLSAFRRVNVEGTERLARQAADSGVKRFVYLSSIKVLGEATFEAPFTASDLPRPVDSYGLSKLEAELAIEKVASESGLEVVIIRPPLVYGPGVGGNFLRLLQIVDKGYPLPLGRVLNKRSLVTVRNLCDLTRECIDNPAAVGKTFLVSDNSDVSTAELLRLMSRAMSRPSRLVPVPVSILRAMAGLLGRSDDAVRLLGSLQVDLGKTMSTLGWTPPVSMEEGIADTVKWYRTLSR